MSIEWWILIVVYILTTCLIFFIPRSKVRLAIVAFLFKQVITFLTGIVVVEIGLLAYPVREFATVIRSSFLYEYYAFPVVCALFNVWYPEKKNTFVQFNYYFWVTTVLTVIEIVIEKYTALLDYIYWEWYVTWITVCITFYWTRLFCLWFFEKGRFTSEI